MCSLFLYPVYYGLKFCMILEKTIKFPPNLGVDFVVGNTHCLKICKLNLETVPFTLENIRVFTKFQSCLFCFLEEIRAAQFARIVDFLISTITGQSCLFLLNHPDWYLMIAAQDAKKTFRNNSVFAIAALLFPTTQDLRSPPLIALLSLRELALPCMAQALHHYSWVPMAAKGKNNRVRTQGYCLRTQVQPWFPSI